MSCCCTAIAKSSATRAWYGRLTRGTRWAQMATVIVRLERRSMTVFIHAPRSSPTPPVASPHTIPLDDEGKVEGQQFACWQLKMPRFYAPNFVLERRGGSTLTADPNNGSAVRIQCLKSRSFTELWWLTFTLVPRGPWNLYPANKSVTLVQK